jgi:hypothetical protein
LLHKAKTSYILKRREYYIRATTAKLGAAVWASCLVVPSHGFALRFALVLHLLYSNLYGTNLLPIKVRQTLTDWQIYVRRFLFVRKVKYMVKKCLQEQKRRDLR